MDLTVTGEPRADTLYVRGVPQRMGDSRLEVLDGTYRPLVTLRPDAAPVIEWERVAAIAAEANPAPHGMPEFVAVLLMALRPHLPSPPPFDRAAE